jgi:hypothetical protein
MGIVGRKKRRGEERERRERGGGRKMGLKVWINAQ